MTIKLKHPVPGAPWGNKFGWRAAIPSIGLPAKGHNGQDFPAPSGTPVLAAANGTVVWSGWDNGSGWGVRLRHKDGYETWYWHLLKQPPVRAGQAVKAGQQIAQVGSTGQYTTGPHLHFGLSLNGVYRDPRPYIKIASKKPSTKGFLGMSKALGPFDYKTKQTLPGDNKWRTIRIKANRSYIVKGGTDVAGVAILDISGLTAKGRVLARVVPAGYKKGERGTRSKDLGLVRLDQEKGVHQISIPFIGKIGKKVGARPARVYVDICHNQDTPITINRVRIRGIQS